MKNNSLNHVLKVLAACALSLAGCSRQPENPPPLREENTRVVDSITATPNPIRVCGDALTGITTLSWTASSATLVEVRVDSPAGALFSQSGPSGSAATGDWVVNGQVFYLQDVSKNEPLTPLTTIASVTVRHTKEGCPSE